MTDEMLGELQHEHRERICAAWPTESYLEILGKLERAEDEDITAGFVGALIASVDRLAAEVDKVTGRV